MSKMPINPRGYSGKYSGSAGRNYSSSRAQMGRGGGGVTPPRKGCGGKKKIVAFLLLASTSAFGVATLAVAIARDLIG